jgi:hypothetical protein
MPTAERAMVASAYALFALQQPLSLAEIAEGAKTASFPMARSKTPTWFAAAASSESSLREMAPELLALPGDDDADEVDVSGIDLIRVYAPELMQVEEVDEPPPTPKKAKEPDEKPRTSTQIGLLRELSNLEG